MDSNALFFLRNAQNALRSQLTQFPALRLSDASCPLHYLWHKLQPEIEICIESNEYTWDAVTSVNLIISMVKYLLLHLVCTTDCLHEQEWWILMR